MKTRILMGLIALLLAFQCTNIWTSYAQRQKVAQAIWEYKMVYVIPTKTENNSQEVLNRHGSEGWDLVSFQVVQDTVIFCLKRPK